MYAKYNQFGGLWDTLTGALKNIGVSANSAAATARALTSPTMENIRAVEQAFASEGTSAPPELLDLLYKRYASAVASYPAAYGGGIMNTFSQIAPWLFVGGVALYFLNKRR